uniref:Uncharacterized protein n=1 Tax=Oryza barthii TaxID=65489 RepID=A0A0D3ETQ9_9ORYZ
MIALCAIVDVAKAKDVRDPWSMKPVQSRGCRAAGRAWGAVEWSWMHGRASWTKVREDALETMTVTLS